MLLAGQLIQPNCHTAPIHLFLHKFWVIGVHSSGNMDLGHNREWCERLYLCRAAGLLLYGRSLGLSHAEAEDVLQETFRALLALDQPPDTADRYVLRALRNRALNYRRSLIRRIRCEFESKRWFEPPEQPSDHEQRAMRQLAVLPRDQREVIVLKIWHQHTFETIGELLGISPNTAAARYRYGLQKLRVALPETKEEPYEQRGSEADRGAIEPLATKESFRAPCAPSLPSPAGG
jgi:RNA polymerase sigma-70 factor (ECF subfamily)